MALSVAPLHSLGQDNQNDGQHNSWSCETTGVCQHYVIQMISSTLPLHSLGQDDQIEVQHDFFGHVTPLAPVSVSHDADGIVNDTTAFFRSRQSK